jgi:allantoinase
MSDHDLHIKNGRILKDGELIDADLFITGRKISSIQKAASGKASHSINAQGLILLPGLIDPHVHFRDPGQTYKEDFLSGTRGAVAGGTTTVFDMPNTEPVVTKVEILEEKARLVSGKAISNFGLIAGASHENLSEITGLANSGAIAFKTYMMSPPKEREKEYAGTFVTNSGHLFQAMRGVSKTRLVHCIHAEMDSTISLLSAEIKQNKRKDAMAHYDSRPNFTEEEAVSDALILCDRLRAKIHIVHVSTCQAVRVLTEAKKRGVDVSSETCPQYMLFSKEILEKQGPNAKFNPPPRNPEDKDRMVEAVARGEVDMISTDHAPHSKVEKQNGLTDIFAAPSGTPGVETRLPLLLNLVHQGELALKDLPRITSISVAKRFGLFPRKGAIQVGADADLAVIDFNQSWKIRASDLQTKAWETVLYDGMEVKGRVKYTIVNGEIAYEDPSGFASPGIGEMIRSS